jgi:hypothetical protein
LNPRARTQTFVPLVKPVSNTFALVTLSRLTQFADAGDSVLI